MVIGLLKESDIIINREVATKTALYYWRLEKGASSLLGTILQLLIKRHYLLSKGNVLSRTLLSVREKIRCRIQCRYIVTVISDHAVSFDLTRLS